MRSTRAIPTSPRDSSRRCARTSSRVRPAPRSRASSTSASGSLEQAPRRRRSEELERLSRNRNVLAAVIEAALGALFLEHGFAAIEDADRRRPSPTQIEYALTTRVDHKTELQEVLARTRPSGDLHRRSPSKGRRTSAASRAPRDRRRGARTRRRAARRRRPSRRPRARRSTGSTPRNFPRASGILSRLMASGDRPTPSCACSGSRRRSASPSLAGSSRSSRRASTRRGRSARARRRDRARRQ